MWRLTRASLWSRKRRLIGGCTAIIIGVGFLAATLIIGDTVRGSYDTQLEQGKLPTGKATLQQVVAKYPDSDAARLATERLAKLPKQ